MGNLVFSKNNFDIKKINSCIESFCKDNLVREEDALTLQLIGEEFLSNILFPNYDEEVALSIFKEDKNIFLEFEYSGPDYMKKINDGTILSLKILQSKTKGIISGVQNNKTNIKFVI